MFNPLDYLARIKVANRKNAEKQAVMLVIANGIANAKREEELSYAEYKAKREALQDY